MRNLSVSMTRDVSIFCLINLSFLLHPSLPLALAQDSGHGLRNNKSREHHETSRQQQQSSTSSYGRLTLNEIYDEMDTLAVSYPDFVTVKTSQEEFGLPTACQQQESQHAGCYYKYIVLEDPVIYSNDAASKALKQRPDVFLSGALHGNERVGPVAMLETAKLLAKAAACESGVVSSNSDDCVELSLKYTIQQMSWLARLVSTRRIVIIPTTNAKGYKNNMREETYIQSNGSTLYLDPNRDFTFDNDPDKCMRTITGRTVNELFRKYLFQMSMTYHGGIENITFEWGAISVPSNTVSPDDIGQRVMADKMSTFAGALNQFGQLYPTDDMNAIFLYSIYGGFEDYVYAGSWKPDMTVQCTPDTYGGYPTSQTTYDDATLSTFNILVEISNNKNPSSSEYGTDYNLLNPPFSYNNNNGYAAKHIRTSLMAIDAVEPYVHIFRYKSKMLYRELKPLTALENKWSKRSKKGSSKVSSRPKVRWSVGGAFSVDDTFLLYGLWGDFPSTFNSINQLTDDQLNQVLNDTSGAFSVTRNRTGDTMWTDPSSSEMPEFRKRLNLSRFSPGDRIAVYAVAKVDQNWSTQPGNIWPNVDAQSHMVNIRTNSDYYKSKPAIDREVQGRLYWISVPLTVKIKAD